MCVSERSLPLAQDGALESDDAVELGISLAEVELRSFTVEMSQHGVRLDKALSDLVSEFSRSYLQQLLEQGAVQLNQKTATKASVKVKLGDVIGIEMRPTAQSQSFKPEAMELDVVYEDAHLLVVNKPAGLVVHPAPGNWSGTLLNGLLAHHAGAAMVPRAGIVHRLDKDTSGLMMVAKDRSTMDALVALIARRDVSRRYLALAHKPWKGAELQKVDAPIGRDPRNRLRMAVVDLAQHAGKEARTDITCWDTTTEHCLVHCKLHTGRTHQIRVHMLLLGHPLVADVLYAGAQAGGMQRQALHAFRLAFVHPVTGESLELAAEPPADFLAAVEQLGLRYNPR
nr:RluA family pseudouridine synthase [Comamonas avium]